MNPLSYFHLQLRLEGKEVVNERFLKQVEAVPGEEIPLMLIAQLASQELFLYYHDAIGPDLQRELSIENIQFPDVNPLLNVLKRNNIQFEVGHYKTYIFSSRPATDIDVICLSRDNPKVKAFGFDGFAEEVYVIEREPAIVSACVSTREKEKCGEAWVYTSPEYRYRGFAQKVVNAWAGSLMDAGKVPFYSHKIENTASANLARKLGLQPVFEEIAITRL